MPNNASHMLRGQPDNAGQFRGAIRSETDVDTFADDLNRHLARYDGDDRAQRAGVDRDDLARAMDRGGDDETIMMAAIKRAAARNGEEYADNVLAENEVSDLARRFDVMDDEDEVADVLKDNFRDYAINNRPLAFPEHCPMMDDPYLDDIEDFEDDDFDDDEDDPSFSQADFLAEPTVDEFRNSYTKDGGDEGREKALKRAGVTDDDWAVAIDNERSALTDLATRAEDAVDDEDARWRYMDSGVGRVADEAFEQASKRNGALYAERVAASQGIKNTPRVQEALTDEFRNYALGGTGLSYPDDNPLKED